MSKKEKFRVIHDVCLSVSVIIVGALFLTVCHIVLEYVFSFATGLPKEIFANISHFWEVLGIFVGVFLMLVSPHVRPEFFDEDDGMFMRGLERMCRKVGVRWIAICIVVAAVFCRLFQANAVMIVRVAEWIYRLDTVALGVFFLGIYPKFSSLIRRENVSDCGDNDRNG